MEEQNKKNNSLKKKTCVQFNKVIFYFPRERKYMVEHFVIVVSLANTGSPSLTLGGLQSCNTRGEMV